MKSIIGSTVYYITIDSKEGKFIITDGVVVKIEYDNQLGPVYILDDGGRIGVSYCYPSEITLRFRDDRVKSIEGIRPLEYIERKEKFNIYRLERDGTILILSGRNKKEVMRMFNDYRSGKSLSTFDFDDLNPKCIGITDYQKFPSIMEEKKTEPSE